MFKKSILKTEHCYPPQCLLSRRISRRFPKAGMCLIVLLSIMLLSVTAFGQTATSLGGTVMDTSRAVLPGANILAVNEDTGVETRTTTNNAGVYNFPSIQPGTYRVTADVSGFQRSTMTGVKMGAGSQNNLNFNLVVAGTTTEVEVSASADSIILDAGSSTGTVLQENAVLELPLLSSDALDLVKIMGGVVQSDSPLFGGNDQTFAGVNANNINVMRDGISVNANRPSPGLSSPARLNPELVGELKMILSPVDAELGRGAGQLQITTRSGSNAFHGSGSWNIQNTALDAYDFNAKHMVPEMIAPRAWRNLHNYTLTASGPIIRNKTFFFVSWDQAIARSRTAITYGVLTPCARKGIYRYLDGVRNANANVNPTTASGNGARSPVRPVVDVNGKPLLTYTFPDDPNSYYQFSGQTMTNELRFESVLGQLDPSVRAALADSSNPGSAYGDCSAYNFTGLPNNGIVAGTAWDDYRNQYDQSGFITRFNEYMPLPNNYQYGDGLNVAGERWNRTLKGEMTVFGGSSYDDNRKAFTVKIDHNINSSHRISATFSDERNAGAAEEGRWSNSYGGLLSRKPRTFTLTLTSTLAPTLLNELRVGMSQNRAVTWYPPENPENGDKLNQILLDLLPTTSDKFPNYVDYPIVAGPGSTGFGQSTLFHPDTGIGHPVGSRGNLPSTSGPGSDLRWTVNDSITWMKGVHAFKAGAEFRRNSYHLRSNGAALLSNSLNTLASVKGGVLTDYSDLRNNALSSSPSSWVGMPVADYDYVRGGTNRNGNYASAYNLMTYITGSIGEVGQYFYMTDAKNPRWNDVNRGELYREADMLSRDWSFFFKDDWKVTTDLTLNLGVRWEYSGLPYDGNGLGTNIRDGVRGAMGASGIDRLEDWMPANPVDSSYRTEQIFIGPDSLNPDEKIFNKDMNNWAPHVGFAWQLPWFGRGMTTLRGGYSISYPLISSFDANSGYGSVLQNNVPGTSYAYAYRGSDNCLGTSGCYLNFDNFGSLLPLHTPEKGWVGLPVNQQPGILSIQPIEKRDQALRVYDPDIRTPYVQSLNMSLTRSVGSHLTADVRYIGTLTRKSVQTLNLNTVNLINNGLMDELIKVRAGGESDMLNDYISDGVLYRSSATDTAYRTGSEQIRRMYSTALASGNLQSVVNSLATANGANSSLGPVQSGVNGRVLRAGGAPETLIYANPQYASINLLRNYGTSNYHSMQAQLTMRPRWGLNFQTTYTWSRNLGRQSVTDYRKWENDYWLNTSHRSHTFTSNGNYTLPFGTNGLLLRATSAGLRKAVEGWNLGWIMSLSSGAPISVAGVNTLWANGAMDLVGPFDTKSGKAEWDWEIYDAHYFGNKYMRVDDPQCETDLVGSSLKESCRNSLKALALVNGYTTNDKGQQVPVAGQIVFQNSTPGNRGNFRGNPLTGVGRFSLDMNMSKSIEFMEGKRLELRIDASNILNHATPSGGGGSTGARINNITNPNVAVNSTDSTPFGLIDTKTQHRIFQANIRLRF